MSKLTVENPNPETKPAHQHSALPELWQRGHGQVPVAGTLEALPGMPTIQNADTGKGPTDSATIEQKPSDHAFVVPPLWQRDPDIMQRNYEPMQPPVTNQRVEAEIVVSEEQSAHDD